MYKIIKEKNIDELEKKVSVLVSVGWKPSGGIYGATIFGDFLFMQAVFKEKKSLAADNKETKTQDVLKETIGFEENKKHKLENKSFNFEPHNLSREEITDVLFYKAKEFYKIKENSMPSSLVVGEITVDSFGEHYCNGILYVWINLRRTVKSVILALMGKERYKRYRLSNYKSACIEVSKEDIFRLKRTGYASVVITKGV